MRDGRADRRPGVPVGGVLREGLVLGVHDAFQVRFCEVPVVEVRLLVIRWWGPVRVVVGVRVVGGRGMAVRVGGEVLQMGQDRLGGGAAAREGGVVEGQGPDLVGALCVQGRVLGVLGGFVSPGLDLAVAGRAVVGQGLEEVGRASGLLLCRSPPVAGAEEEGAGAGEGDVAEAEFLGVLVVLHGLVEGLHAA